MLGRLLDWCPSADLAADIDQFERVQEFPAVVALVTSGFRLVAVRAGSLHVPIREEARAVLAVVRLKAFPVNIVLLIESKEDFLYDTLMVRCRRPGKQIKGDAELLHVLGMLMVIPVHDRLWGRIFLLCSDGDRCPMLVASRDHKDFVASHAVEPSEDVSRQIAPCDMSQMK